MITHSLPTPILNRRLFIKRKVVFLATVALASFAISGYYPATAGAAIRSASHDLSVSGKQAVESLKSQGQYDSLQVAFRESLYRVRPAQDKGHYAADNLAGGVHSRFDSEGVQVVPHDGKSLDLQLIGYGYGDKLIDPVKTEPRVLDNRVEYRHGSLTEWWVNGLKGLEQGFTLTEPPQGRADGAPLAISLSMEGGLKPSLKSPSEIVFLDDEGRTVLHYADLKAWDAAGKTLPTRMELRGEQLALLVEDRGASYPVTVDPLIFTETKLLASNGAIGDNFGFAVALSGDTALVGARGDDDDNDLRRDIGSAYVFVRKDGAWSEQQKLTPSDGEKGDYFGSAVALSGDTALVGARYDDNDDHSDMGSAYVFRRSNGVWSEQQKLTASDGAAGDNFGVAIALSGDTALVGTRFGDGNESDSGAAYVFQLSDDPWFGGQSWSLEQKLIASDGIALDEFGTAVAFDGDTAIVGALGDDDHGSSSGSAYVFRRNSDGWGGWWWYGAWSEEQKLSASDGVPLDMFGAAVALSGDTALVGAYGDDDLGNFAGAAYVFLRNGNAWSEQQKLIASDGATGDNFGSAVALFGDTALVGARYDDDLGNNSGSSYLFMRSGMAWSEKKKLTAADGAANDKFGNAVALSGNSALVGAYYENSQGILSGAAYLYENASSADLSIVMRGTPNPVKSGAELTYMITVQNNGPNKALDVVVTDPLPSSITFKSVSYPKGTTVTTPPVGKSGTLVWKLGNLDSGAQGRKQLTIKVIVNGIVDITNIASVKTSPTVDPKAANNSSKITVKVLGPVN